MNGDVTVRLVLAFAVAVPVKELPIVYVKVFAPVMWMAAPLTFTADWLAFVTVSS